MSQGVLRGQGFVDVVNNNTKMVDKEQGWQADKVQDISGRRHHKGGGWQSCDGGQPFCGCRQGGQKHLGGQQCLGGQLHQDGRQNQGGRQHKGGQQQQQQAPANSNKIILEFIFQSMQYKFMDWEWQTGQQNWGERSTTSGHTHHLGGGYTDKVRSWRSNDSKVVDFT